jgi:protein TonB
MNPILENAFDPTTRISGQPAGSPNVAERSAYSERQVEKAVLALPGTTPRYPSMLQSAGLEGDVRAQFVVDTLGRVEPGSFRALESTHALFTDAVRDALGRTRFTPAEAGGHKVRQLVEQVFTFRISR